jgi:hypothetical protein
MCILWDDNVGIIHEHVISWTRALSNDNDWSWQTNALWHEDCTALFTDITVC